MVRRVGVSVLGLLIWAAGAGSARAASSPELLLFDEPAVSAAAKHPQRSGEAPAAVSVITREDIRRFGYRTLAEALRSATGFYTSSDRVYSYVGVRGFLRPGDYNDRILLLVDGHTHNDDVYHTAYLGNEFGIDLEAVDHIEVIRGPGSALYGGNALLAVVNVVTLQGKDAPGLRPLVETGSYGRKRGQVSWGYSRPDGLDIFLSGSVLDLDGAETLFFPAFDSLATHRGVAHDDDAERAFNLFASARYGDFRLTGGANSREKHDPTGAYDTTFNDGGSKSRDQRQFADVLWSRALPHDLDVMARAYYDGTVYHGTYIYGAGSGRMKNEDRVGSDWIGSEVQGRWRGLPRNALTVGAEYTYHPHATQDNFDLPSHARALHDTRTWSSWGVYAQDEVTVHRTLTLIGGLRFDEVYDGQIAEVSPRGALIWAPVAATRLKLLYGRAFRPPNLYEQYYAYEGGGYDQITNPDLAPEKITTYEVVLEQSLWGRAQGLLTLYRYEIEGLIEQVTLQTPGGTAGQFQNLIDAVAHGAETEVRIPLPAHAALRLRYAIQSAEDDEGRVLNNSPKHLGGAALLLALPFGIEAGTEIDVVGPRLTIARRRLEAARLLNLTLHRRGLVKNLDVGVGFYNLLDQTYPDPAGGEHRQDRIPQDGFTFRARVQYAF